MYAINMTKKDEVSAGWKFHLAETWSRGGEAETYSTRFLPWY